MIESHATGIYLVTVPQAWLEMGHVHSFVVAARSMDSARKSFPERGWEEHPLLHTDNLWYETYGLTDPEDWLKLSHYSCPIDKLEVWWIGRARRGLLDQEVLCVNNISE